MLSWLGSLGLKAFFEWLLSKLMAVIALAKKDKENHEHQVNQAAQDSKPAEELKPDATEGETDVAIDSELDHL